MSFAETFSTFGYVPPVNDMEASNFYTLDQVDTTNKAGNQVRMSRYTSSNSTTPAATNCGCQVLVNGVAQNTTTASNNQMQSSTSAAMTGTAPPTQTQPTSNMSSHYDCGDFLCYAEIDSSSNSSFSVAKRPSYM